MNTGYPITKAFNSFKLPVSDLHTIYVEERGNPKGVPVVFLHGGPGGGITDQYQSFFNPEKYRVILFDQRGCGQIAPHAELKENTTWDLVKDIETIREHLKINQWHVFGGSWGSTLSLIYAINHPQRVLSLQLRGIFMCRKKELQWFYQEGASKIYPDAWEPYYDHIPKEERGYFISAYYKRLTHEDPGVRLKAAKIWSQWEASTSHLYQDKEAISSFEDDELSLAFARIECHYFINKIFLKDEDYIINNIEKIKDIPCEIVQGRYDVVCPMESAWELHKAYPKSVLHIIEDAGHSALEPEIQKKLIEVTDRCLSI